MLIKHIVYDKTIYKKLLCNSAQLLLAPPNYSGTTRIQKFVHNQNVQFSNRVLRGTMLNSYCLQSVRTCSANGISRIATKLEGQSSRTPIQPNGTPLVCLFNFAVCFYAMFDNY